MKYISLFTTIIIYGFGFSQNTETDYKKIRTNLVPVVCGLRDSVTLREIQSNLENLDTTLLKTNLHTYYIDLASVYYELTIHPIDSGGYKISTTDSLYLLKGIECYNKALYHEPNNTQALWNSAFSFYMIGDCSNMHGYLNRYKIHEKRKYWDKDQIKYFLIKCPQIED